MGGAIVTGLAALVLAVGCGKEESTNNNVNSQTTQNIESPIKKADIVLNLEAMRGITDFGFVIDNKFHYLFSKNDDKYRLIKTTSDQLPQWVAKFNTRSRDSIYTMDLGDGTVYSLDYNIESGEYQLLH